MHLFRNLPAFLLLVATAVAQQPITPDKVIPLFNGKDLSAFTTWLVNHKHEDPDRVFTVVDNVDGAPAIRISGEHWGGLVTKERYTNYRFVAEFRWGPISWGVRKNRTRDSGILFHCQGEFGNSARDFNGPWMRSVEYQIIEGGTGDLILVGGYDRGSTEPTRGMLHTTVKPGTRIWDPAGEPVVLTTGRHRTDWQHKDPQWKDVLGFRGPRDVERPVGEWNRLEAICDGGSVVFFLNGVKVNEARDGSLTEGSILIQSEGAELFFRRIELHPLPGRAQVGRPLPAWTEGTLDIHQVNTGRGDAAFFILPDGTTFLLDAGDMAPRTTRSVNYDAPTRPDDSRRAGEWVARYIRDVHPHGRDGALDYAAITHFHADHMGGVTDEAPMAASGAYRLAGITDVGEQIQIRRMLDRAWPEYDFPRPLVDRMMMNYRAFLEWQVANRQLQAERFEPGRKDQIVLRHAADRYPTFEVRNIAANGRIWTGEGAEARSRYPAFDRPGENNCSLAFRLRYGAFTYFNGGDMPGELSPNAQAWHDIESALAWVVGPVDVHALNHHGFRDSANAFFLSVLQPRVHILAVYASSHPGPEVMRRMLSPRLYPGPRDIFMTNAMWEGRRANMVELFGQEETAFLEGRIAAAAASQGHVVVRVTPGGDSYHVFVLDDRDESRNVLSIHGPYPSGEQPVTVAATGVSLAR
jgi:hypothetical protein